MSTSHAEVLFELPEVQKMIAKKAKDEEANRLKERCDVIDRLCAAEREAESAREYIDSAKARIEEARSVLEAATREMREVENRVSRASSQVKHLRKFLYTKHGESAVDDARVFLVSRKQGLERQLAYWDGIKPKKAPGGLYDLPLNPEVIRQRTKLRTDLNEACEALEKIIGLERARISPGDLSERVESIMEPFLAQPAV